MGRIKPQALLQQSKKKKAPSGIGVATILLCCFIFILTLFFLYSTYKNWWLRAVMLLWIQRNMISLDMHEKGHFKGMCFRHVIKHNVIQAGGAGHLGSIEDWTLKGKHYSQLDTSLKHEAFMLGTSKTKHDDGGFELFITAAPIPDLSKKLTVLGRVIKGEDVIQEIEEMDTDEHYQPKSHVEIIDVTMKQKV